MAIWIQHELCSGCGICIKVCPYGAVEIIDAKAAINERCIECGACARNCPVAAVSVRVGAGCATAVLKGAQTGPDCDCADCCGE